MHGNATRAEYKGWKEQKEITEVLITNFDMKDHVEIMHRNSWEMSMAYWKVCFSNSGPNILWISIYEKFYCGESFWWQWLMKFLNARNTAIFREIPSVILKKYPPINENVFEIYNS